MVFWNLQLLASFAAEKPKFITGISDQSIHDNGELSLRIRTEGVPRPEIRWLIDGKQLQEDARHIVETQKEAQIVSELTIKNFCESDVGLVSNWKILQN